MESKINAECFIEKNVDEVIRAITMLKEPKYIELVKLISDLITDSFIKEKKLLICGNGGSAADAQHIAGEFVSRFLFNRPGLPAIAITTDTSILTAIGNDYGYENLFARQIEALGNSGDTLIAISTSGNSQNVIKAINSAKNKGLNVVGLTGGNGGEMKDVCDICFIAPSEITPHIQEVHITIGHIICGLVEENIFGGLK